MLLRLFRYFAAVAKHESIVAAAKDLHISQPALSRQIQQLEEHVGAQLIERQRRGIRLTPAGESLLASVRTLFERIEQAVVHAHAARDGVRGSLHIGLGRIALDNPRVTRAIAEARKQYPMIRQDVSEIPSSDHRDALRGRDIDIAVGALTVGSDDGIARELLYPEPVDAAVVAASHPAAGGKGVDVTSLAAQRFLTLETSATAYPGFIDALKELGITRIEKCASLESIYHRIAAGHGWTTAPHAIRANPPFGCAVIPLHGFSHVVPVSVAWRASDRSRSVSNVVRVLVRELGHTKSVASKRGATDDDSGRSQKSSLRAPSARMELEHFRALAAALDEGSMSRAAARLNLTQSGISRRLRILEREVGLRLLQRVAHGVVGTPAGNVLRAEVNDVLRMAHEAVTSARSAADGVRGTCTIGTLPAELTGKLLMRALRRVEESLPDAAIELVELNSDHQENALRDRQIDIGLAGGFPGTVEDPAIASVVLVHDPIDCVLVSSSHPFAARAWLTAADLASEPFLFLSRDHAPRLHDFVMRAFAAIGLRPITGGAHSGPRVIWRIAADSMGWTIAMQSQRANPPRRMVAIPVEGLHAPWAIKLLWRRDEMNPIVLQVLAAFRGMRTVERAPAVTQ